MRVNAGFQYSSIPGRIYLSGLKQNLQQAEQTAILIIQQVSAMISSL
jgi:hypothetical protein